MFDSSINDERQNRYRDGTRHSRCKLHWKSWGKSSPLPRDSLFLRQNWYLEKSARGIQKTKVPRKVCSNKRMKLTINTFRAFKILRINAIIPVLLYENRWSHFNNKRREERHYASYIPKIYRPQIILIGNCGRYCKTLYQQLIFWSGCRSILWNEQIHWDLIREAIESDPILLLRIKKFVPFCTHKVLLTTLHTRLSRRH